LKAEKQLLDTAETLQALVIKNKKADGVETLGAALAAIYDAFVQIVDEKDPRIAKVHYNLAETLFQIGSYDKAVENYRWIVDHGQWGEKGSTASGSNPVAEASLKAIASRYEVLRQQKLIPVELAARPLNTPEQKVQSPSLVEWVRWIDFHASKTHANLENFYFESNRSLYSHGQVKKARRADAALRH